MNIGNVVQALDAATGELIWEHYVGPNVAAGAMRGLAIYDDKIFFSTSNARVVALDARSGEVAWDTTVGERSEGDYVNSSGPIVINGKVLTGLAGCARFREEKCFISAYDAVNGNELWRFQHHRPGYRIGRGHVGRPAEFLSRGRRDLDHRQL